MGEHYYSQKPLSAHATRTFAYTLKGRMLRFETDAGVFSKAHVDNGTALLHEALPDALTGRALDLGCGWGALGVWMAAQWPSAQIDMVDINERAVALSQKNIAINGLRAAVYTSDSFSRVKGTFDLIATNPPIRAGKAVVYRLYTESIARLNDNGALYVVIRKQQGAESTLSFLKQRMADVQVVKRGGGYWVIKGCVNGFIP